MWHVNVLLIIKIQWFYFYAREKQMIFWRMIQIRNMEAKSFNVKVYLFMIFFTRCLCRIRALSFAGLNVFDNFVNIAKVAKTCIGIIAAKRTAFMMAIGWRQIFSYKGRCAINELHNKWFTISFGYKTATVDSFVEVGEVGVGVVGANGRDILWMEVENSISYQVLWMV